MLLAAVLHIGLMGHGMGDSHREWWGRLGGWLVLYSVGWFLLFSTAVYVPYRLARISSPQGHKSITAGTVHWDTRPAKPRLLQLLKKLTA
jgi:hypothetical protein